MSRAAATQGGLRVVKSNCLLACGRGEDGDVIRFKVGNISAQLI